MATRGSKSERLIQNLLGTMCFGWDAEKIEKQFPEYLLEDLAEHYGIETTKTTSDGVVQLSKAELLGDITNAQNGLYRGYTKITIHGVDVEVVKEGSKLEMSFYRAGRKLHSIEFEKDVSNWQFLRITDENSGKDYAENVYLSLAIVYGWYDEEDTSCFCFVPVKITTAGEVIVLGKEHWYQNDDIPESYLAFDIQKQGFSEVEPPVYCR